MGWGAAELGFCVLMSGCGGAGGYFLHAHLKGRKDAQIEGLRTANVKRLREVLVNDLRRGALEEIDFEHQVSRFAVSRAEANGLADTLFLALARKVLADGVVTARERYHLSRVAKALRIDIERAGRLEDVARYQRYEQAEEEARADGVITADESAMLDELRTRLGLHPGEGGT